MTAEPTDDGSSTSTPDYADRLRRLDSSRWRQFFNVQAPYRWNIRRLNLGHTLDLGCGLGRNLAHLGGDGVGIDHNPDSVAIARSRGLEAFTNEEFLGSKFAVEGSFDSILFAHVAEHLSLENSVSILDQFLPMLKTGGTVCFITPQERGFASDSTHVRFVDFDGIRELAAALGLTVRRQFSFPFPRLVGRVFTYNEFVALATKGA